MLLEPMTVGGKRNNLVEAEAVASAVAGHARTNPNLSLGIVRSQVPRETPSKISSRLSAGAMTPWMPCCKRGKAKTFS